MAKCEVTWDEYDIWSYNLDVTRRKVLKLAVNDRDKLSDAVTRPTRRPLHHHQDWGWNQRRAEPKRDEVRQRHQKRDDSRSQ